MRLRSIKEISRLKGKRVFLRSDLNAPLKNGEILNDFRLVKARKTIDFLRKAGAKVILTGHIGRNFMSLSSVYEYFKNEIPVSFTYEVLGEKTNTLVKEMNDGDVVMLENLRTNKGELLNDNKFSKELSSLADVYVNDAFSVSHREHASIIGMPKYLKSYAGILFQEEVSKLSEALIPPSPSLCILGGAKFSTKETLIKKMLDIYDIVFVSGALAHDFFKAKGFNIGKSLSSKTGVDIKKLVKSKKIMMPTDVIVQNEDDVSIKKIDEVSSYDIIKDSGPETVETLKNLVRDFKFVLWNGPLGEYEKGFIKPTEDLARALAETQAKTLIGGGDTIAAIEHLKIQDKFSFISTGGGAMLKFLLDGTLVGIEALKK